MKSDENVLEDCLAKSAEQLKKMFPDAVIHGNIDFCLLDHLLADYSNHEECYSFTWHGKSHALQLAQTPPNTVPQFCPQDSIDWDTTRNLYYEGDNLDVLKLLQNSHAGKIKMIYIDPPYNTGNDFVYCDDFRESMGTYHKRVGHNQNIENGSSGRYHTNWLNMMYPRLWLASRLLTQDGVMFISIDDNEIDNLKKICGEIFGEENYINLITVKTKTCSGASGGGEDKRLKKNTEYLLVYARNREKIRLKQPKEQIRISDYIHEHKVSGVGFYYTRILEDCGERTPIGQTDTVKIYAHRNYRFSTVFEKMKTEGLSLDEVYAKYFHQIFMVTNAQTSLLKKANDVTPREQMLVSYEYMPRTGKNKGVHTTKYVWNKTLIVWFADSAVLENSVAYKCRNLGTLWDDISWGRLDLQGDVPFKNGKKPLKLMERLLDMATDKDLTVLDFFSGSATTAHAVMEQNARDGGTRKFIMVQIPQLCEKGSEAYQDGFRTICEIGRKRICRAGGKIKAEFNEKNRGDYPDVGFQVIRMEQNSSSDKKFLAAENH